MTSQKNKPDETHFRMQTHFPCTDQFVQTEGFPMRLAAIVELQAAASLADRPSMLSLVQQYRDICEHVQLALAVLRISFHADGIYVEPNALAESLELAERYGVQARVTMEPL
jgi:hypothetical protein